MDKASYKSVVGWEGLYEVSDIGMVRSLRRKTKAGHKGGNVLSLLSQRGYSSVNLCKDGYMKREYVHKLVLTAFVGEKPEGHECCHNNGNRTDNRVCNLRWDTHKNNMADQIKHGTYIKAHYASHARKETWKSTKLTKAAVKEIRGSEKSLSILAKKYNVTPMCISQVKNFKVWK